MQNAQTERLRQSSGSTGLPAPDSDGAHIGRIRAVREGYIFVEFERIGRADNTQRSRIAVFDRSKLQGTWTDADIHRAIELGHMVEFNPAGRGIVAMKNLTAQHERALRRLEELSLYDCSSLLPIRREPASREPAVMAAA